MNTFRFGIQGLKITKVRTTVNIVLNPSQVNNFEKALGWKADILYFRYQVLK